MILTHECIALMLGVRRAGVSKTLEALEKNGVGSVARDLMAEKLRKGMPLPIRWKVLLALADDTVLMSLPFFKLVPAAEPPPPGALDKQ